jgi:putative N6-adenine-specific DNA methylase
MTGKYNYQKSNRYFAQVADDIKELAEQELIALGAEETSSAYRGVYFNAAPRTLYTINLHSSLINRVLAPLTYFHCYTEKQLYRKALQIDWEDFLDPSMTLAVFATVSHKKINHSKYAALRVKDAVVDYFRERTGKRPSIDTRNPDVWINLYLMGHEATISVDTSGGSLHRRGYRRESVQAPMAETLAAAIIKLSQWDGTTPLYDPFCGSGTLLCEAYLHGTKTPPALFRKKFGFERLPEFDRDLWNEVQNEGKRNIVSLPDGFIAGSDISAEAVFASATNCGLLDKKLSGAIEQHNLFDIDDLSNRTIITNPPYGVRMAKNMNLADFYKRFGDFLKQRCKGSTAYVYFGERKYIKNIGLKPTWKKQLSNGGLDGRLVKFEMY